MLHPRVRHDDEETGDPRTEKHQERGPPMAPPRKPPFSKQEQAQKCRLQKEGEHSFHRQRLPDHPSGDSREPRPVRAELKFYWNAGHHPEHKIDSKDARPEARAVVIDLPVRSNRESLK